MDEDTIKRLNAINHRFYQITGAEFDQTRGQPWPGWERLLPHLAAVAAGRSLRVLDVGCGNGRFGRFLLDRLERPLVYHGLDSSETLLVSARAALCAVPGAQITLTAQDVLEQPLPPDSYDVVALFGVLHHVPGAARRREFMRALAARVTPGGLFAFSAWRFYDHARFRARIVPWPDDLASEPGDYMLDWRRGTPALRYCHHVDDDEHAALIGATGLRVIDDYRADGRSQTSNRYGVLRRAPAAAPHPTPGSTP